MIKLDYTNISDKVINEQGLDIAQCFDEYSSKIREIITNLNMNKDKPGAFLQWMNLGYAEETVWYVKEFAAMVDGRFDNVLVLGTGGSALGGLALSEALLKPYWNLLDREQRDNFPRIFFLDNIDPDEITALLNILDLKKTLVNVITKSGSTAETMSQFMVLRDKMYELLGDDYRKNVVATTDKQAGILRQLANEEGYKTFVVPDDVAGRFSVFSAVGLLPLALVGIDIDEIIKGIKIMDLTLKNTDIHNNIAAQNALIHYLMDKRKGKHISVMMPYSSRLRYVPDFYTQLWAESLAREYDKNGNKINNNPTPIKALGVSDQHSQMQMFCEGKNDKVITFIRVDEFDNELNIPNIFEYTGVNYLGGKSINRLMNAQADATAAALCDYNRPNLTIRLPKINEYYLAQLFYMFEMQTAIIGELYDIDAFVQVESDNIKNYTYALMGKLGYEESAHELNEKINKNKETLGLN